MHTTLESKAEIEKIAYNLLKSSKAWGVFPTPINAIVNYAELSIAKGIDLSKVKIGFFEAKFDLLTSALRKVRGVLDYREKIIYLDQGQINGKKNFITLHEVGHGVLPWQQELRAYMDDDLTLDPCTEEQFEREASIFASSALFQLDRFTEEADQLPLALKSAQLLAKQFGGSNHAALRKYVETSKKRCALLVLNIPDKKPTNLAMVRDYFQSQSFVKEFGIIEWPEVLDMQYPFVQGLSRGRKFYEDGQFEIELSDSNSLKLSYHYFFNGYNCFVFMFPSGEKVKSRVKIIV